MGFLEIGNSFWVYKFDLLEVSVFLVEDRDFMGVFACLVDKKYRKRRENMDFLIFRATNFVKNM